MRRESYIDTARGIGILSVIFCHVIILCKITELNFISDFCYSFHMPLFFFISGYCQAFRSHYTESYPLIDSLKKTLKRLFLPYFIWSFIYLFIGGNLLSTERLYAVFTTRGIAPIWFLATLGFCEITFTILRSLTQRAKELTHCIILGIFALSFVAVGYLLYVIKGSCSLSEKSIGTPLYYLFVSTGRFFMCMPMLLLGYLFCKADILRKLKKLPSFLLGTILLVAVFFITSCTHLVTNIHLFTTNHYFVLLITSVLGSLSVLLLAYAIPKKFSFPLELCGKNSLYLMLLHYVPFKTISISAKIFKGVSDPCLFLILTGLSVTLLSALGTFLIKHGFFLDNAKKK